MRACLTWYWGFTDDADTHPSAAVPATLPVAEHPGMLVTDPVGVPGQVFSEHNRWRRPYLQRGPSVASTRATFE